MPKIPSVRRGTTCAPPGAARRRSARLQSKAAGVSAKSSAAADRIPQSSAPEEPFAATRPETVTENSLKDDTICVRETIRRGKRTATRELNEANGTAPRPSKRTSGVRRDSHQTRSTSSGRDFSDTRTDLSETDALGATETLKEKQSKQLNASVLKNDTICVRETKRTGKRTATSEVNEADGTAPRPSKSTSGVRRKSHETRSTSSRRDSSDTRTDLSETDALGATETLKEKRSEQMNASVKLRCVPDDGDHGTSVYSISSDDAKLSDKTRSEESDSRRPAAAVSASGFALLSDSADQADDLRIAQEVKQIRSVSQINESQLAWFIKRSHAHLQGVANGKIYSARHEQYHRSGRERRLLDRQGNFLGLFTEDQADFVGYALAKSFAGSSLEMTDYVLRVLLAEQFKLIYMGAHGVSEAEAERVLSG